MALRDGIELRTAEQLERIRDAGRIVHAVLQELARIVAPGMTTLDLDRIAEARTREADAEPAFLGYHGYPASICISVNEEVVHGIPSQRRVLRDGDVVGLDFGVVHRGWFADSAITVAVGAVPEEARRLVEVTREALGRGIAAAVPGARLGDVGAAVQGFVESRGFSVVRDFVGHGIGRRLHEPPQVPNYGIPGKGRRLEAGMVIAIEPMVNAGRYEVRTLDDGWTAVTLDGRLSAHFEHTVAVTDQGPVVLTDGSGKEPAG